MNKTNTAAIESLRNFAMANSEIQFAHMCNAALAGEAWAVERVNCAVERCLGCGEDTWIHVIRTTDTARPDGAIARSIAL